MNNTVSPNSLSGGVIHKDLLTSQPATPSIRILSKHIDMLAVSQHARLPQPSSQVEAVPWGQCMCVNTRAPYSCSVLIINFRKSNHFSLINWSLWEGRVICKKFSSLAPLRKKPGETHVLGNKGFPGIAARAWRMFLLTGLSTAAMWKQGKWKTWGFAFSGKYWRNVGNPRELPAGTETGIPATFPWESHGL